MADVHRAYDPLLDRTVALKVLHTEGLVDEAQQRRRILREARAAAALTHPNTVTIFEVGEAGGLVFIAMELLDGETLRSALLRETSVDRKLRWLLEAARALEAAHERGLVHRDVKPENMFVCFDGTLRLLDFGIAKRDEDEGIHGDERAGPSSLRTAEGRRVGTPRYMAPEQKAGAPTDPRTDQYAWGLVAFEMLTGSHPIAGFPTLKIEEGAVRQDENTAASAMRLARLREVAGLPEEIARAVLRTLEERKEDRFESMAPLVALLEEALSPASAPARASAPEPEPARAPPRRRGTIAVLAVVAVAAALAAGGGALARFRTRPTESRKTTSVPAAPPACKVDASRAYPATRDDRVTLAGGTLVVAREGEANRAGDKTKKRYEREAAGGLESFEPMPGPMGLDLRGETTAMHGGMIGDKAAVAFHGSRLLMVAWASGGPKMARRLANPIETIVATTFRDSLMLAVVGPDPVDDAAADASNVKGWLGVMRIGTDVARDESLVSVPEGIDSPAIAATNERIGVAFSRGRSAIRFAYFDPAARIVGDVMPVATVDARPALAFAGESPLVLWVADRDGSRRLLSSMLAPGATKFAEPVVAVDEPVASYRPAAARLPDGSFAAVWAAARDGRLVLRVAAIRSDGTLSTPADVAVATGFRDLAVATTSRGVDLAWIDDGELAVRAASVSCSP